MVRRILDMLGIGDPGVRRQDSHTGAAKCLTPSDGRTAEIALRTCIVDRPVPVAVHLTSHKFLSKREPSPIPKVPGSAPIPLIPRLRLLWQVFFLGWRLHR